MAQTTSNTKFIKATAEQIYQAFTDAKALEAWLAPGDMTGKVHHFDWREGGGYEMSLFYPGSEKVMQGKTSAMEDRYTAKLVKLEPFKEIIQAINFDSPDPRFAGEMIVEVSFDETADGTNVTFLFKNIPTGIRLEDNEKGTLLTLEKLARYVEQGRVKIDEQDSDGSANAFEDK
ncbi:MAG: SRPBCC domain-containing protein [Bacteroidota bacterium]